MNGIKQKPRTERKPSRAVMVCQNLFNEHFQSEISRSLFSSLGYSGKHDAGSLDDSHAPG